MFIDPQFLYLKKLCFLSLNHNWLKIKYSIKVQQKLQNALSMHKIK